MCMNDVGMLEEGLENALVMLLGDAMSVKECVRILDLRVQVH